MGWRVAVVLAAVMALTMLLAVTPGTADAQVRAEERARQADSTMLAGRALPEKVVQALVAVEDSRFYSHPGIDGRGAGRAVLGFLNGDGDAGGSTLNQQLAKHLYTGGRSEYLDKLVQVVVALKMDVRYDKDQILRMYLDTVDFGPGYRGVVDASRGYFGVDPEDLDWSRAALLAGLLQAPSLYDPRVNPGLALDRRNHVLDRLVATGVLGEAQADAYKQLPVGLG